MQPWNYSPSYAARLVRSSSDTVNFSIDDPYTETSVEQSPVLSKLLEAAEHLKTYVLLRAQSAGPFTSFHAAKKLR